jgi:hypothetical protein
VPPKPPRGVDVETGCDDGGVLRLDEDFDVSVSDPQVHRDPDREPDELDEPEQDGRFCCGDPGTTVVPAGTQFLGATNRSAAAPAPMRPVTANKT